MRHPAAVSADSDLIRLTREFESLREALAMNDHEIAEHEDAIRASSIDHQMGVKFRQDKIAHAWRQRRTLEVQFTNVNELLAPLIQTERACNGCSIQP